MSSLEQKAAKLKALRAKKQQRMEKIHTQAARNLARDNKITQSQLHSIDGTAVVEMQQEAVEEQPRLQVQNYVGTLRIMPKQKSYMYNQGVNVTRKEIDQTLALQEEEEAPVYDAISMGSDSEDADGDHDRKESKVKRLRDEDAEKVMGSTSFRRFIRRGSAELDDALNNSFTLLEDILENENPDIAPDLREKMALAHTFEFDPTLQNFACLGLGWCKSNANLILGIYNTHSISEEFKGRILIWDLESPREPKITLLSLKKINRAQFDTSRENIIYGALASGQIVYWDTSIKNEPMAMTKPSMDSHILPIYCLQQVSDGKRDLLISLSYEGKLCVWNKETVVEVERSEVLTFKKERGGSNDENDNNLPIAPTVSCLSDLPSNPNCKLFVATHDNIIQEYNLRELLIAEESQRKSKTLKAHEAPVCSLSIKRNRDNPVLDGLMLSGSFDFSIALTLTRDLSEVFHRITVHEDYVTAIEWNPIHPAVFASADCSGKLCLWNLLEDVDYPSFVSKRKPISSLSWHPDGFKLIIGTLDGDLELWNVKNQALKVDEERIEEFEKFIAGKNYRAME